MTERSFDDGGFLIAREDAVAMEVIAKGRKEDGPGGVRDWVNMKFRQALQPDEAKVFAECLEIQSQARFEVAHTIRSAVAQIGGNIKLLDPSAMRLDEEALWFEAQVSNPDQPGLLQALLEGAQLPLTRVMTPNGTKPLNKNEIQTALQQHGQRGLDLEEAALIRADGRILFEVGPPHFVLESLDVDTVNEILLHGSARAQLFDSERRQARDLQPGQELEVHRIVTQKQFSTGDFVGVLSPQVVYRNGYEVGIQPPSHLDVGSGNNPNGRARQFEVHYFEHRYPFTPTFTQLQLYPGHPGLVNRGDLEAHGGRGGFAYK